MLHVCRRSVRNGMGRDETGRGGITTPKHSGRLRGKGTILLEVSHRPAWVRFPPLPIEALSPSAFGAAPAWSRPPLPALHWGSRSSRELSLEEEFGGRQWREDAIRRRSVSATPRRSRSCATPRSWRGWTESRCATPTASRSPSRRLEVGLLDDINWNGIDRSNVPGATAPGRRFAKPLPKLQDRAPTRPPRALRRSSPPLALRPERGGESRRRLAGAAQGRSDRR